MGIAAPGPDPTDDTHVESRGSSKRFLGWVTEIDWAARLTAALNTPQAIIAATKTVPGIVQLATAAQAVAATNDTSVLTPAQALAFLQGNPDAVAALTGSRRGTAAQRAALTGAQLLDQLRFYETDTRRTYVYSTAGGYWFRQNATAIVTYNGAQTSIPVNATTRIPYDTTDTNDDTNLFTPVLGANGGIQVNRGGLYRVSALMFILQDSSAYVGALLLLGATGAGTTLREANQLILQGRLLNTFDYRIADGANPVLASGLYPIGNNPRLIAGNAAPTNYNLQVTRLGD